PRLHLARLARPLDSGTRRILAAEPIVIPAADRQRFLRDFLPALRARLQITSQDGSVEIPEPRPGRLTLAMTHDESHTIGLTWRWRYPIGDDVVDIPLSGGTRSDLRDADAERPVLEQALQQVRAIAE